MRLITTMLLTGILVVSNVAISGPESATLSKYNRMKQLEGEWVLSPATRQEGKATQHKVVAPLVGTEDGNHLVTSYTTFNDGAYMKDSVYHFDRK
jgi:hypothetical protein